MNRACYDETAVARLGDELLDWRHRVAPPSWHGRTIATVATACPDLLGPDGPDGPFPVIDRPALLHNIATMADWCRNQGVSLAPHGKTTMAPQLIATQIDHGVWGVTVASLAQARVLRAFGVSPLLVANEVLDEAGLRWLADEQRRDPEFRLLCWVDSPEVVELLDVALGAARAPRMLDVLVEIGLAGGRTGCRTSEQAERVASAVTTAAKLRLAGVAGYEGVVTAPPQAGGVGEVDAFLARLNQVSARLARGGLFDSVDEVIVTAGGSVYFDRVAAVLGDGPDLGRPARVVVRSGCYVTHDHGHYARLTPAARGIEDAPRFQDALRVWARVLSRPEPRLAVLAAGRRDLPYDQDLPVPVAVRDSGAARPVPSGWQVTSLYDQHAILRVNATDDPAVGDWVALGVSHPCTLFDRWSLLVLAEHDRVAGLVRTFF